MEHLQEQVIDLRDEGYSFGQIAEELGIAKSTAHRLYNEGISVQERSKNAVPGRSLNVQDERSEPSWNEVNQQLGTIASAVSQIAQKVQGQESQLGALSGLEQRLEEIQGKLKAQNEAQRASKIEELEDEFYDLANSIRLMHDTKWIPGTCEDCIEQLEAFKKASEPFQEQLNWEMELADNLINEFEEAKGFIGKKGTEIIFDEDILESLQEYLDHE